MKIQNLLKSGTNTGLYKALNLKNFFTDKIPKHKNRKLAKGFYGAGNHDFHADGGVSGDAGDGGGSE